MEVAFMIRLPDIPSSRAAQHAREDFGAAWEHLLSAAEHSARQVGDASRRHGLTARERAAAAALALRGRQQIQWRWLAIGLAAGVVVGAAGAAVVGRRLPPPDQARARAGAAVTAVRERVGEAAQTAAATARTRAEQVRDRFGRPETAEDRLPEQPADREPDQVPEQPATPTR
jgi:hypothetical protein